MTINQESLAFLNFYFDNDLTDVWVCDSTNWKPQAAASARLDPNAGWYWCPARVKLEDRGKGLQRYVDRAYEVRGFIVDDVFTKIAIADFKLWATAPSTRIETSKDNWQFGYRLAKGTTVAEFEALRARLPWKADGVDCVHWWRLPGGVNPKKEHNGFRTGKAWYGEGDIGWLSGKVVPPASGAQGSGAQGSKDVTAPVWMIAEVLDLIPNDATVDYDRWIEIGHAIHAASEGSADGEQVWVDWSNQQPQPKRDPGEVWKTFKPDRSPGMRKLIIVAGEKAGPQAVAAATMGDSIFAEAEAEGSGEGSGEGLPNHKQLAYADAVARMYGTHLRWNLDRKVWMILIGSTWRVLPGGKDRAAELSLDMARRAPPGSRGKGDSDTTASGFHDGVEKICRRNPALQAREADFNKDPMLLGTPGGIVDLKTGSTRGTVATDLISKSTAVAPAQTDNCPRWKKFIHEVTQGDLAAATFLQQWAGYCLTGLTRERMFLFLWGPGGNGKTVFADTLGSIMGDYFVQPDAELFVKKAHGVGHTSKLAMLSGARLCTISEVPAGSAWNEQLLKDVTGGGGLVTAGFKHRDEFSFRPVFKLMALGNHEPTFPGGVDQAIKDRFKKMGWTFRPKVVDKGLKDAMETEWPGILRWMITGAVMWASKGGLLVPQAVEDMTEEFFDDQDLVAQWLAARVQKAKGSSVKATDLFENWREWRNAQGEHGLLDNPTAFGSEMTGKRGLRKTHTMTGKVYQDVKLVTSASEVF